LILEHPALFTVFGARGEKLLEGEPFLTRVLDHLHDHRRGPGMNDPNDPITTDLVFADGVGIGRHGSPFTTKSIAVWGHPLASPSVISLRTLRFLMTLYCTRKPKKRGKRDEQAGHAWTACSSETRLKAATLAHRM